MKCFILWLFTFLAITGLVRQNSNPFSGLVVCAQEEEEISATTAAAATTDNTESVEDNVTTSAGNTLDDNTLSSPDSNGEREEEELEEESSIHKALEEMSNEELEAICTSRGFELVQELDEDNNVKPFTRDDYLDAAKQCLDVESEMEQILKDHPDLLEDIEAEAERMRIEKENLEQKLDQVQEELEKEKQKAGEKFTAAFDDIDRSEDVANDNSDSNGNDEATVEGNNINEASQIHGVDNVDEDVIDLDNCCDKTKPSSSTEDDALDNANVQQNAEATDSINEENHQISTKEERNSPQKHQQEQQPILTVKDIVVEFRKQMYQDFKTVSDFIFPVPYREPVLKFFQPAIMVVKGAVIKTYDMARRYITTILKGLGIDLTNKNNSADGTTSSTT